MTVLIEHRLPSDVEFMALRAETDWGTPSYETAEATLAASLCGAVAIQSGQTVGIVRAVGDGGLNLYLQDVIIAKHDRSKGLGTQLIQAFVVHLGETYPPSCLIGLFAAKNQSPFYHGFGFNSRPTTGFGPGMHATLSHLTQAALAKADNAA